MKTMRRLTLPSFAHKILWKEDKRYIFDTLRKKYVSLTPEEWVRQHMVHYLIGHLRYPATLMRIECVIPTTTAMALRSDILVYSRDVKPLLLVECKAANQQLSQAVCAQVMRYNHTQIPLLLFTNGIDHFCFQRTKTVKDNNYYIQLDKIPAFNETCSLSYAQ